MVVGCEHVRVDLNVMKNGTSSSIASKNRNSNFIIQIRSYNSHIPCRMRSYNNCSVSSYSEHFVFISHTFLVRHKLIHRTPKHSLSTHKPSVFQFVIQISDCWSNTHSGQTHAAMRLETSKQTHAPRTHQSHATHTFAQTNARTIVPVSDVKY